MSAGGVCCIVLAAGSATRFGSDKRVARLATGLSLLQTTLQSIPDIFCEYLLVLRPGDEALSPGLEARWRVVPAGDAGSGMGHSLAAGLAAAGPCRAALVALADMPAVSEHTFRALADKAAAAALIVPRHDGRRGNPVVLGADFFPPLLQPDGDQGARALIEAHPESVCWLDTDDAGILQDVDTPSDLRNRDPG